MIQALLVMLAVGAVCGLILGIAGKKFHVEKDTRVEDIRAMLPGLNCGGCGKAGCDAMADALVNEGADINDCRPSKPEVKEKITEYLAANAK